VAKSAAPRVSTENGTLVRTVYKPKRNSRFNTTARDRGDDYLPTVRRKVRRREPARPDGVLSVLLFARLDFEQMPARGGVDAGVRRIIGAGRALVCADDVVELCSAGWSKRRRRVQ